MEVVNILLLSPASALTPYTLTTAAFQLVFGRLYTFYSIK